MAWEVSDNWGENYSQLSCFRGGEDQRYITRPQIRRPRNNHLLTPISGAKLEITYDSVEDLQAGKNTELPSNIARYAFIPKERIDGISRVIGLAIESGLVGLKAKEGEILNELLPEVKPMSVEEFLRKSLDAWCDMAALCCTTGSSTCALSRDNDLTSNLIILTLCLINYSNRKYYNQSSTLLQFYFFYTCIQARKRYLRYRY